MAGDGSISKRSDGRFELQLSVGKQANGKLKRKSFYGHSKAEVREKRDNWFAEREKIEKEYKNMLMQEWSLLWAETYKRDAVQNSTYKFTYLYAINNYINPYLGASKVRDIKKIDVQKFFNTINTKSSSVLDKVKKVLFAIFEEAIEEELCVKNPCKGIKIGKYTTVTKKDTYSKEESDCVIEYAKTHKHGLGIILMLKTGIRRGELLALKWDDIDFENKILNINKSIKSDKKIGEPKSAAGIRAIPFDNELYDVLLKNKDNGFVIKNNNGDFMDPNNYNNRTYKKFMNDMYNFYSGKIKMLTAHELRHTYGTLLRARGVDIYSIQKVMGHSNIHVTADIYIDNDISVLKKNLKL